MLKIPANVAALAKLAAAENPRYALMAVLVSEQGPLYQVEATDGRRLGVVRGPGGSAPRHPRLTDVPNGATEALIPAKDFAELVRKGKGLPHNETRVVLGDHASTFLADDKVVVVRNVEGRWPPIDQAFPKKPPAAEFAANAKYLSELLLIASLFGDDDRGEVGHGNVLIRFWDANTPIAVQTANHTGQSFYGMLMPVSGGRLAPPIEPELPAWVEQLAEAAEALLQSTRKPNGDRLKTVRLADCLEQIGRLEVAVKVAKAALAACPPDESRAAAEEVAADQEHGGDPGAGEAPAHRYEVEEAADEPAEGDGHQSNGQPR
jgi:hypothetical protein